MPPLAEPAIKAIIIDDSRREQCQAHCGLDWSLEENLDLARARLLERFGGQVRLDYCDLVVTVVGNYGWQLGQQAKAKNLPLPVLIINGEPKISGQFDIRLLLDAIDAEIEIGSKR